MANKLILAAAGAAVLALGACAPGHFVKSRWDLIRPTGVCQDSNFVIYFEEGSALLTKPAHQLVQETARRYGHCAVTNVRVVGLSDAAGTPAANLSLSQQRAQRVAEALTKAGLPAPAFEQGLGDQGAVRKDGKDEPMRRRAEVFLSAKPR